MTTVHVLDSSTVTLHGVAGTCAVSGPLTVGCEAVTVGGSLYQGEIVVSGGAAFQALRHSGQETALASFGLVASLFLGFIASRFAV